MHYGSQVGYGAFLATSLNMPRQSKALVQVYVGLTGRKLLQVRLDSITRLNYFIDLVCLTLIRACFRVGTRVGKCSWSVVGVDDGCYIHGWKTTSDMVECKCTNSCYNKNILIKPCI